MKRLPRPAPKQRNSSRRERILDVLVKTRTFLSSQEIHNLLQKNGASVGLATVYRQLEALVQKGIADSIISPSGEKLFRHCGQAETHHHHIICRVCGLAAEIDLPEIEKMSDAIAKKFKYSDISHSIEIFGVCSACAVLQSSSIKSRRKPKLS